MHKPDAARFHKLYGVKKPRIAYAGGDFLDYLLMLAICDLILVWVFGPAHLMTRIGSALCLFMAVVFAVRHGVRWKVPVIASRPQDVFYMFLYRIQNLEPSYIFAIAFLVAENYAIHLTPGLPHHVALMHRLALYLFFGHFMALTCYRTAILIGHLRRGEHIREFLSQTSWKGMVERQPNISLEIWHAYFTGILAHILLVAPWYLVIRYFNFSLLFMPLTCLVNVVTQARFLKILNPWFYRDHWLCHNSELEFLYLHGPHHDAIPSGLIGVSGNGHLEGFLRHGLGVPSPFFNPLVTFVVYCFEVKGDIEGHQFIPGVYPNIDGAFQRINQHSTHHFARLEPYSFGMWLDQPGVSEGLRKALKMLPTEITNSIHLDEELTGFAWDSPRYRKYLDLYDKYEHRGDP